MLRSLALDSLLLDARGDVELGARLVLDLLQRRAGLELDERELALLAVDLEDGEVRDDEADAARASQGQGALLNDLGLAVLTVSESSSVYNSSKTPPDLPKLRQNIPRDLWDA